MKPLHKRNDLKFFIDTAVYCQQPAKHDELVRIIRDNYGSLEFSAHTADINLVHPGETDCDAFAHVPGILVNFRYIEDANRRRLRGCPRLPFTQHIIAKCVSVFLKKSRELLILATGQFQAYIHYNLLLWTRAPPRWGARSEPILLYAIAKITYALF